MPTSDLPSFAAFAAGLLILPLVIGLFAVRLDRRDEAARAARRTLRG